MTDPVRLAIVWHLHQPSYRDGLTGRVLLPWTRLHATKDYRDMAEILRGFPNVHVTFNLTPVLLDQIESIANGESDDWTELARKPADRLSPEEQRLLARRFFHAHRERMIDPYPRYRELRQRLHGARGVRGGLDHPLAAADLRDLAVWFFLTWVDPSFRTEEPIRSLIAKGRGFTEEEKAGLLDWTTACASRVLPSYRDLLARGQAEIAVSAYHHPILPLLIDSDAPRESTPDAALPRPPYRRPEDAAVQVRRAREAYERRFGGAPEGTWPPEGAVNDATLSLLAREGFHWTASDETVLARALGRRGSLGADWSSLLYRPYEVATDSGPIRILFRDRALSDLIGFTYMYWDPERAAEDFVARVRRAGERGSARPRDPGGAGPGGPLVTVILDGENCWEGYPDDGRPFLLALYDRLSRDDRVRAVTVREALDAAPPRDRLTHLPVGSWIRDDLGIWIGDAEKNRAWIELRRAREALAQAARAGTVAEEAAAAAADEIYAAEASDWFWWYGETHQSAQRAELDTLFRSHLLRCYALLQAAPPGAVRRSLRGAARAPEGPELLPHVVPTLDGRETDFYEWRGARMLDVEADAGAMHATTGVLTRVRYGVDERSLFVRADWRKGTAREGMTLRVVFPGPPERAVSVPLARGGGEPVWDEEGAGDAGTYAVDRLLEVSIPFSRLRARPGTVLGFRVQVEREGTVLERAPRSGVLTASVPTEEDWLELWSGT
ncbi:MAG TPA: glycoside hydrolase family 57 protein [Candidatus Eisenbacteria bacterium]|jgi:alpha-amylase/alpha-mannosidase (GH57 family)